MSQFRYGSRCQRPGSCIRGCECQPNSTSALGGLALGWQEGGWQLQAHDRSEAAPGEGAPRASESQRKSQRCISLALLDCLSIPGQATVPRGTCPLIGQPAVRLGKLVHPELHGLRVRKWPFPKKGTGLQDVDVANDHDEGTVGQARPSLVAALLTVALLSPSPPPPQGRGALRR